MGEYGVPEPHPLGRERSQAEQDDIARAVRLGQDRERAKESRKTARRQRWFRFLHRR